jgi:arylsulfatase A-like enzyme
MLGDHGRWGKIVPYHPSSSVPLIVAGPGIRNDATSTALLSHIDLTATFLDYAGVPIPRQMDSRSFRSTLEGRSTAFREVLFSGLGAWRMAFDGEYKAITGFNPNRAINSPDWTPVSPQVADMRPLIFDLAKDAGENADLYAAMPNGGKHLLNLLAARAADDKSRESL